jgi:uncharacterized protein
MVLQRGVEGRAGGGVRARGQSLSVAQARRIALRAQGFTDDPPGAAVSRAHVRRVLARIGLLQIDSVNVLVRSHYLPLFSRLGIYRLALLDDMAYGRRRELFEYWGHEASLLPLSLFPLLRWRMERALHLEGMYGGLTRWARENKKLIAKALHEVEARGPLGAGDIEGSKGVGSWWGWSDAKTALEYLFWAGRVTTAYRRSFERVYDLTERIIPAAVYDAPAPDPAAAQRELLRIAMHAHGVATERDLRDYFRLRPDDSKPRVAEMVEAGELLPVTVEGWKQPAYIAQGTNVPRKAARSALLSPFDSLVWERERTHRLFDFHYRLEIYTPKHKRIHGYYVLPFLHGDALVARVDLKADRAAGALQVKGLHVEPGAQPAEIREALEPELERMRGWLGLERVTWDPASRRTPRARPRTA